MIWFGIGNSGRRYRVTQPELVPTHPLGPWRAADVRVRTLWGGGLDSVYRTALTPELQVYSWQGFVEADDFDPPQVQSVAWDPESGALRVQARDAVGVAYLRVAYTYDGQRHVQQLALAAGDARSGEWTVPFPAGAMVKDGELVAGDELYNQAKLPVMW